MRKPRLLKPGYTYHVMARVNRGEMLFEGNPYYKDLFIGHIHKAKLKYTFEIINLCIMGNHIHLQIKPTGDSSLSKIMQYILGNFAREYNKIKKQKGHVWQDRFKSKIIDSLKQYIRTFLYIAKNPVRACLVDHPFEYIHNGITAMHWGSSGKNRIADWSIGTINNIIEPPDNYLLDAIEMFLSNFSVTTAKQVDKTIGFFNKKPGRPKKK